MKRVSVSKLPELPNIDATLFSKPSAGDFKAVATSTHAPRILLLYGSLRERSFSRLLTFEPSDCSRPSVQKRGFLIPPACLFPMVTRRIIPRFRSSEASPPGRKAWYGPRLSVMAR
jgi:hypothetical protein